MTREWTHEFLLMDGSTGENKWHIVFNDQDVAEMAVEVLIRLINQNIVWTVENTNNAEKEKTRE